MHLGWVRMDLPWSRTGLPVQIIANRRDKSPFIRLERLYHVRLQFIVNVKLVALHLYDAPQRYGRSYIGRWILQTSVDRRPSTRPSPAHPRCRCFSNLPPPTTLSGSFFLTILKRVLGAVYTWRLHTLHAVLPMNVEHQFVFANDMPYGHMQTRPALVLKKVPCSGCPLSVQFGIERCTLFLRRPFIREVRTRWRELDAVGYQFIIWRI